MDKEIRHTADLPLGYQATFIWSKANGCTIEWKPDVPRISSRRAFNQLRAAYNVARHTFYQDVVNASGVGRFCNVLIRLGDILK